MVKIIDSYIKGLKDGLNVIILHFMLVSVLLPLYILLSAFHSLILACLFLVLISLMLTIHFFRDPVRETKYQNNLLYSPADGIISSIDTVQEKTYLKKRSYRIKIFMNLFNVHRNLIPFTGIIDHVQYSKGRFRSAFKEVEQSNEQFIIRMKSIFGKMIIKQIAGLIARRLICNIKKGDRVKTGQGFGMIKCGSAVIIYLPSSIKLSVKKGDKVKAGITELASFNK